MHNFHRAIVAGAPIGLGVANEAGDFVVWNDAMLSVSGFTPAEEAAWKRQRASEAARASRTRMLEVVRRQGGLFGHELTIPKSDGTTGIAVVTIKPVEIAGGRFLHVTMEDFTERKHLEGALRESELRFRQVAETVRQVFVRTGTCAALGTGGPKTADGGGSGGAGSGGAAAAPGVSPDAGADPSNRDRGGSGDDSGCACDLSRRRGRSGAGPVLALGLFVLLARPLSGRRRRPMKRVSYGR